MKNFKKWTAYFLYVIGLALFFLYVCFPSGSVSRYVEQRISHQFTGVQAQIGTIVPGLPPALVAGDIEIAYRDSKPVLVDRIALNPSYSDLIMGRRFFNLKAETAGGLIQGILGMEEVSGNSFGISLDLDLDDIRMEDFDHLLSGQGEYSVQGEIEGRIEYSGAPDFSGTGSSVLQLGEFQVNSNPPFYGMSELDFRQGKVTIEINNGRMNVSEFSFEGNQFSATGGGRIMLTMPVENSRINITAKVAPHQALFKSIGSMLPQRYKSSGEIPVRITGTLGKPRFSLR